MDEISRQIDDYEERYGQCDRSDFDGEFVVPAEIRNRVNSKGSLRIHGGLLTISRSRTFLTLSNNSKSSIHSSTPDLSRSVPNTPGSNHKLSLTSSYDSVLEENEEDGSMNIKKGKEKTKKNSKIHSIQHMFDNAPLRRKSEDFLEARSSSSGNKSIIVVDNRQQQPQHIRQSSDQAYRLIPRIKKPINEGRIYQETIEIKENANFSASTSNSLASLDTESIMNYSQWGQVRGSNSFAADLNISNISTYTIPRVILNHQRAQSIEPQNHTTGVSRKSLPENRVSTFLVKPNKKKDSTT